MWAQFTSVTDGRTDIFTVTKTALCRASRGKNGLQIPSGYGNNNKTLYGANFRSEQRNAA